MMTDIICQKDCQILWILHTTTIVAKSFLTVTLKKICCQTGSIGRMMSYHNRLNTQIVIMASIQVASQVNVIKMPNLLRITVQKTVKFITVSDINRNESVSHIDKHIFLGNRPKQTEQLKQTQVTQPILESYQFDSKNVYKLSIENPDEQMPVRGGDLSLVFCLFPSPPVFKQPNVIFSNNLACRHRLNILLLLKKKKSLFTLQTGDSFPLDT